MLDIRAIVIKTGGRSLQDELMELIRGLMALGLTETESRFYLAALELGPAPVREIAAKSGITRTSAYDVYARLLDQKLVAEVANGGRAILVTAEPPEHLLAMFEQRRRRLHDLLPDLESLHNRSRSKPRIRFYQGLEGIKTVLEETINCRSKKLLGILSMRDLYQVLGRAWMDDLVKRRIAAGVSLRVIRSPRNDLHSGWHESRRDLRELRFAPSDFVFSMTTYIYDEKVAFISTRRENFAMTIESADFAAMQTDMFEVLWRASSVPPRNRSRRSEAGTANPINIEEL